ncbi:hypothetical protein SPONL_563 [uncultured Candidatus Thioglobus sp.]|nr:hypothetical protein SPONL_563 [uncultured Candidatus Thioglobus sp.]
MILIPVCSFLIGAIAFVLNVRQTTLNNKICKAKIVSESLYIFMDDNTMCQAFYKIEYGNFSYGSNFHGSKEEKEIDKLLRHFSNIALMWQEGLLSLSDIRPIQYFILRVVNDPEIIKYLLFINQWSNNANTDSHPYLALNKMSKELNEKIT